MQHKIVTVTLIPSHNIFQSHKDIIRCPYYGKLFTALFVLNLKLKLNRCTRKNRKKQRTTKAG
jgi:DMSO/TMAO reductase YedYZ heme-binding membrane subunit